MFSSSTTIRIHYALTDQMGFVYHGHYAQFYEIGRTEAIRSLGFTYKDIEALGIIMPVIETHFKFISPARYDDLITVKTTLKLLPEDHKITFYGEIFNEEGKLLNTGEVILFFMNAQEMKRAMMPDQLRQKIEAYFK